MIALDGVSKWYRTREGRRVVLRDVDAMFPTGCRTGILGGNGAGKSTLVRLLAGAEQPTRGTIRRRGRISFPVGFDGTFHPALSGRENIRFLARVYGVDARRLVSDVADFSELGQYLDMPVETYSSGMRAKLAFGTCLAIDFDMFLIDEVTAVGDERFQARCRDAFESRLRHADLIMVSHDFSTIRAYCRTAAILSGGRIETFADVDEAITLHRARIQDAAESLAPAEPSCRPA